VKGKNNHFAINLDKENAKPRHILPVKSQNAKTPKIGPTCPYMGHLGFLHGAPCVNTK
jgi:hypothetical protein